MNSSLGPKYETRFMDMRPTFISGYKVGKLELSEKPILFEEDGIIILNKKLADFIKINQIPPVIWFSEELLSLFFNQWTHAVWGKWVDPGGVNDGKLVTWSWVESLHKPKEDKRAISLEIEGFRKFIWVLKLIPENHDLELNLYKGVWPD